MSDNSLRIELSAMQDIALTLDRLDPPTRARVLRWIMERFEADHAPLVHRTLAVAPAAGTELRAVPSPGTGADETLSVEALTDLFEPHGPAPEPAAAAPQSITGMLQDLVAEFQDLAREWSEPEIRPAATGAEHPLVRVAS